MGDRTIRSGPRSTTISTQILGGRYELRGLIGRGGMAEVHRGYDRQLDRDVAIKIMHPALGSDVDHQRFASEMRLLAGLNHPGLVTLLDAGLDRSPADGTGEGSPARVRWLVMELVDGPSLSGRLDGGPMAPGEVALIGAGIAGALAHVHASGIVHRDVKPANILLTSTGQPKLADFGIARAIGDAAGLTGTGHTIGTALYLSPEQVSGGTVTGASDVYALGLVLLEALTGRRAYDGTPVEAAMARLHRRPLIPVSLGSGWVRLLDAMTATDPAERPAAAEAAARLGALGGAGQPAFPAPVAPPATRTASLPKVSRLRTPWPWSRRFAVAGAAGAA
ncbi:serine/threonine-protein kinase, partial [Nocardioides stalactiti]|uniref:serine/threonine-protein kinase n=1 Tax=Nocardioides stalactiti TaxID=2755356 RepID=UPI0016040E89